MRNAFFLCLSAKQRCSVAATQRWPHRHTVTPSLLLRCVASLDLTDSSPFIVAMRAGNQASYDDRAA